MAEQDEKPGLEVMTKSLLDVAVESWRFGKLFDRLLLKLDAGEQGGYRGSPARSRECSKIRSRTQERRSCSQMALRVAKANWPNVNAVISLDLA